MNPEWRFYATSSSWMKRTHSGVPGVHSVHPGRTHRICECPGTQAVLSGRTEHLGVPAVYCTRPRRDSLHQCQCLPPHHLVDRWAIFVLDETYALFWICYAHSIHLGSTASILRGDERIMLVVSGQDMASTASFIESHSVSADSETTEILRKVRKTSTSLVE